MNLSELLTTERAFPVDGQHNHAHPRPNHTYPTRHASSSYSMPLYAPLASSILSAPPHTIHPNYEGAYGRSPIKKPPKTINFQLILSETPHHKARLPLRINIQCHDSTESIITTVKNFYGLYEGEGVSFEDSNGVTLIAQYENLGHNCTVLVRVTSEHPDMYETRSRHSIGTGSPQKPRLDEPFQMLPPQPYSRPQSRTAKKRSASPPSGRGHRSASLRAQMKTRPRNGLSQDMNEDIDGAANGLSDSDAGSVSVTSSRRAKNDQVASADISLDNIVEGGRRKRAKFESSELPLFAPPQQPMTASMSSMSPQRRLTNSNIQSPMGFNNQSNFIWNHSLPSPQSHTFGEFTTKNNGAGIENQGEFGHRLRARTSSNLGPGRQSGGSVPRVLPTPDPTIGSVISDEDVALQLMRLGDASNLSLGRTSTSTMDDAQSGKAEAASSGDETDEESENGGDLIPHMSMNPSHVAGPARKRQKIGDGVLAAFDSADTSGEDYDDYNDSSFRGESDGVMPEGLIQSVERVKAIPKANKLHNIEAFRGHPSMSKTKAKAAAGRIPPSPYSLPGVARNGSVSSLQLAADEDDLSSKPRCQRCRKSKKGCDRQRPCQRCKDAGIGVDGCVSEDEGNGRKGRYGRHMGVPVKRESGDFLDDTERSYVETSGFQPADQMDEVSKKRKR